MLNKKTKSKTKSQTKTQTQQSRRESIKKAKKELKAKEKPIPTFLSDEEAQIENGIKELIKADIAKQSLDSSSALIKERIKESSKQKQKQEQDKTININASNDNSKDFDYYKNLKSDKENKEIEKGRIVISMSKTSLLGIIFGLFLMTAISFIAGFIVSLNVQKSSFMAVNIKDDSVTFGEKGTDNQSTQEAEKTDYNKSVKETINSYVDKIIPPKESTDDGTFEKADEDKNPVNKVDLIKQQAAIIPNDSHAGRFTVEVTSSSKGLELQKFARKLQEKKYGAYLVRTLSEDGETEYFSLRIGSFADYDYAYKIAAQIRFKYKDKFGNASVVVIKKGEERVK